MWVALGKTTTKRNAASSAPYLYGHT